MTKDQIQIGNTYTAKVTDKVVPVRIDAEHPSGGWTATNLVTNKKVRIKSAQRLREKVKANADAAPAKRPVKKKLTAAEREAWQAQHKADQVNARVRDERAKSKDGMTASERAMAESAKDAKQAKARTTKKQEGMSCLDAAAKVLEEAGEPMNTKAMVEAMAAKGYWTSDAPTPWATLYSALLREMQKKGNDARFTKVERGKFTLAKGA
jgi:hypothetical protein